ncbi:methyl-CpG-binding domain-containing protein 2 [Mercurialis annua]|uniref:methyl-CpG-binding domain-containing protein 2 n=1 Tax=Mercurialis annua TaxID=3986 RepID=UPI00215E4CA3|nr:methyl-CpG-binding domain-containing protein 2 [Mercurialis annua]XP_050218616.1 methyl-CpG-binding domain-containing protein 2 [Mercurialis annua]
MQSHAEGASFTVKKEVNDYTGSSFSYQDSSLQNPIEVSSSSEEDDLHDTEDINEQSVENASKQIVLYDPLANGNGDLGIVPQPIQYQPRSSVRRPGFLMPSRVLPSVGAFTVQCASCFKWRLIPTKNKYEEIREHILEQPFYCETAREWQPNISCNDPADISQDGSRLWAIDKPNIAQPPRGWQRLLRIRGQGSSKFADVYYQAPSGKRFRSMVEIRKFLDDNPEYERDGVTLSQFSFRTPRPLQENYLRKRPRPTASCDKTRPFEPCEANPIAWVAPDDFTDLQLGRPAAFSPPTSFRPPIFDPIDLPAKQARRTPW